MDTTPKEPRVSAIVHLLDKHTSSFVALVCMVGISYIYNDWRDFMRETTDAIRGVSQELREINVRISTLESRTQTIPQPEKNSSPTGARLH